MATSSTNTDNESHFVRVASAVARWSADHALPTIVLFVAMALLGAGLAATKLKVDTNPALMINGDLQFRQNYNDLITQFPELDNAFVLVIDADKATAGRKAAADIAKRLETRPDLFTDVFAPGTGDYFDKYGVLYLDEAGVKQVADEIREVTPLINTLALQPDLSGVASLFQQMAPVVEIGRAPAEVSGFLDKFADTVEAEARGEPRPLDWTALGDKPAALNQTRWYVLAKPVLDFTALDPAAGPISDMRLIMVEVTESEPFIKVQLTGEAALNAEEFDAVIEGAALAGALSFTFVTLAVVIGFPSLVLVIPALALIVLGFLINAGFAAVSVGTLNMISVAFAVLFIGLGIDYAVHVILRFAEERAKGANGKQAAIAAVRAISMPLGLCTLTTALAFLAFTPTDFVGMAQLGIIAAGGIVIAFIGSISLVPAILSLLPGSQAKIARVYSRLSPDRQGWLGGHGATVRKVASGVLIAAGMACVVLLPQVRFDGDPINLKDPAAPSMQAFDDLVEDQPDQTFAIQVLSQPGEQAAELVGALKALPEVLDVETLDSMLPPNQGPKLAQLEAVTELLPEEIEPATVMSAQERIEQLVSWRDAASAMAQADSTTPGIRAAATRLEKALTDFMAANQGATGSVQSLEASLVQGFPALFKETRQLISLDPVTIETVDEGLRRRFIAPDGRWRLNVLPCGDMRNPIELEKFVKAVRSIAPQATGAPVEITGAAQVVSSSMGMAVAISLVLVLVVTFIALRQVKHVLLTLAPLLLAGALMAGYTVVFKSPFNFANVIVLPLLIGLGIDSAIHYVSRARDFSSGTPVIRTWTPRAVLLSGVTTMGSFGTLWLSPHRGMASMGELLAVAITITLLCTLVVLPQLIFWFMKPFKQ
jgi:hopanoid biosynthesis associated RND transporter like protein HpnN